MKNFLIFIGGFVAGLLATFLVSYVYLVANKPNDGLLGLSIFEEKGDCLTSTSNSRSSEIDIFQVIAPNAALATIKYYTEEKQYSGSTYRIYDFENDIVILLINYDGKTYYDGQKIDVSKNCLRQIGTYQYETTSKFGKTVPAIVIE
ncbi:MAG: hypothetical protein WC960_07420 [Bacteroidales bacterium]